MKEKEIPITIGYTKNATYIALEDDDSINPQVFALHLGKWLSSPENITVINSMLKKAEKSNLNTELMVSYVDDYVKEEKRVKVFLYINFIETIFVEFAFDGKMSEAEWYSALISFRDEHVKSYIETSKIENPIVTNKDLPPYGVYKNWPTNPENIEFIIKDNLNE